MKYLDWQGIIFVGATLVHDYWILWRLPRIQYWESSKDIVKKDEDDNDKAA